MFFSHIGVFRKEFIVKTSGSTSRNASFMVYAIFPNVLISGKKGWIPSWQCSDTVNINRKKQKNKDEEGDFIFFNQKSHGIWEGQTQAVVRNKTSGYMALIWAIIQGFENALNLFSIGLQQWHFLLISITFARLRLCAFIYHLMLKRKGTKTSAGI